MSVALIGLVDARCRSLAPGCTNRSIYRMVGYCENCGARPLLILHTAGHESYRPEDCPLCGCRKVRSERLATEDEIPAAVTPTSGRAPVAAEPGRDSNDLPN